MLRAILLLLTGPVIYLQIVVLVALDLFLTVYQYLCFPVYRIELVRRDEHIVIDRHQLAYLSLFQRFNCLYCSYGNGVLAYAAEIAVRTESYWCPIKHARRVADRRRDGFADYGDEEAFRRLYRR